MARLKLILQVEEFGGKRTYRAEEDDDDGCQTELARSVAYHLSQAVNACLNVPPTWQDMLERMYDRDDLSTALCAINRAWSAERNFNDCVRIVVDWGKLNSEPDKDDVKARSVAEKCGVIPADPSCIWESSAD